jgi:organic radical activating enzyme
VVNELPLSEVFGSLQGEGPHAGKAVTFIRLGGCNLSCTWCDTPYTWDAKRYRLKDENPMTAVAEIVERTAPGAPVVITGGEPLMHQGRPAWQELLGGLARRECEIHIETNGTLAPNDVTRTYVDHYTVSPKLTNAGAHKPGQDPTIAPGWDSHVAPVIFKFVCTDVADAVVAVHVADGYGMPRTAVWLMPEGRDTDTLLSRWPAIANLAVRLGCNATQRLHVLAWGDRKGT